MGPVPDRTRKGSPLLRQDKRPRSALIQTPSGKDRRGGPASGSVRIDPAEGETYSRRLMDTSPASGSSPSSESTLRSVMLAVATAQFLLPFMMSGMGPLLPSIGRDLDGSAMELGLVGVVYALSLSIFHLLSGRIGDILGRRRIFLTGLTIFLVMAGITPFSPTMPAFLVCRFLQAVGTAMMNTSALSILVACAPPSMRGRVLGVTSIGMYAGVSLGPALAGFITTWLGWRYLFFSVVPLGLPAWVLMAVTIKQDWTSDPDKPYDWRGSVLYSLGICAITAGAAWITAGWWAGLALTAGFVLLGVFAVGERSIRTPILDVRFLLHNFSFLINTVISLITNSTIMGLIFFFSLYLQGIQHLDVLHTGLVLSVQPVVQLLIAPWGGKLADRKGPVQVATAGLVLCGLGLFLASRLTEASALWEVPLAQIWVGAGLALFASSNTSAIMGSVDYAHLSQASGLVGTMRTMGILLSMVIVSVTMHLYLGMEPLREGNEMQFLEAMHVDCNIFGALNLTAVFLSVYQLRLNARRARSGQGTSHDDSAS